MSSPGTLNSLVNCCNNAVNQSGKGDPMNRPPSRPPVLAKRATSETLPGGDQAEQVVLQVDEPGLPTARGSSSEDVLSYDRRAFIASAIAGAASLALPRRVHAAFPDLEAV